MSQMEDELSSECLFMLKAAEKKYVTIFSMSFLTSGVTI